MALFGSGLAYHPTWMTCTALIVAGGSRPDPLVVAALPTVDFCVAADGGADNARQVGIAIDAVVGDMDSISHTELAILENSDVEIARHPAVKDRTDLELAFDRALEVQPDRLLVIGFGGGRVDHELASMALLASPAFGDVLVDGLVGSARLAVVRRPRTIEGVVGETISLIPMLGPVGGVTTEGLEFPLEGSQLDAATSRGVSNRFVAPTATVSVSTGVVLAVQPYALKDRGIGSFGGQNGHGVHDSGIGHGRLGDDGGSQDYEGGKDRGG